METGDSYEADQLAIEEGGEEQEPEMFGKAFRKRTAYDREEKGYLDDEISLEESWEEEPEFQQDSDDEL